MKKSIVPFALLPFLALTACNDSHDDADTATLSQNTALSFGSEACWFGGTQTDTGLDSNNNGSLDADEITQTDMACSVNTQFSTQGVRFEHVVASHIAPTLDDANTTRNIEFRRGGFGSDMVAHPSIANRFYTVTDRGWNANFKTDFAPSGKRFPDPTYVPRIGEFEVTADGKIVKIKELLIKDRNGDDISGLPNPAGLGATNEIAFGLDGKPLLMNQNAAYHATTNPYKTDSYGLDAEGLVALADGTFWISDEYGPHIIHIDAQGKELDRINPFVADDRRVGGYVLPAEFSNRRPNRGMEGLTITPDGKTLVGIMQSAMSNPNGAANKSNMSRIVTINLDSKEVAQYLYRQGVESDNISGNAFSNSAIVALDNNTFLVIERDGKFYRDAADATYKRVYKIDLRSATNLETIKDSNQLTQDAALGLMIGDQTLEQIIVAGGEDNAFKAGWDTLAANGIQPATKTLTVDMVKQVNYPHDKMEGLWVINGSTLGVVNDDDFALWANADTFALQQKYLDSDKKVIDGNALYIMDGLDLTPAP